METRTGSGDESVSLTAVNEAAICVAAVSELGVRSKDARIAGKRN